MAIPQDVDAASPTVSILPPVPHHGVLPETRDANDELEGGKTVVSDELPFKKGATNDV